MLNETIAFSRVPASEQNRFTDRISVLYLEYVKIRQSDTGVMAYQSRDDEAMRAKIQIPVGVFLC